MKNMAFSETTTTLRTITMAILPLIVVFILGIIAGLLIAAHSYEPDMEKLEDKLAAANRELRKLKKNVNH